MASIQTMVNWFEQRAGKVTYSMANRYGPSSFDCSSAVYYALQAGGFVSSGTMGNTTTLFTDLPKAGFTPTTSPKRGDVFLWGKQHSAGGRYGHTGVFIDSANVIHCSSSRNGIVVVNYQQMRAGSGNPTTTIYSNPASDTIDKTPSFSTEDEKTVYTIWSILRPLGYSLAAIAGIIGNAVAECDLNPDLSEKGGCGYGLWQWTGNRYPLNGVAAACGAQYTINLMNAAGITGDYRTATPQTKLLDWTMTAGQWIGKVEPATVAGFKAAANVEQATRAFMSNYERPGTERFDVRLNGANTWYLFLQNLSSGGGEEEIEESDGYEELTNVGELEFLGVENGKIVAEGCHFSSNKEIEYIQFMNAKSGKEIQRIKINLIKRADLAEEYPNVLGVELSGFKASITVPDQTAVYVNGIRSDGNASDDDLLTFDGIIIYEKATDAPVDEYAETNTKFFFEILNKGKVVKRGSDILNQLEWDNELMNVPSAEIVLPIEYRVYFRTRAEVKLYINRKVFHGKTIGIPEENKQAETITVSLVHVIHEWNNSQILTNLAVRSRTINDIYGTLYFRPENWNMNFLDDSARDKINYVYSRQGKLDGLTKTCELTSDLFWRVGFNAGRTVDIGRFGHDSGYRISVLPSDGYNIQMINEPIIEHDYENVINKATVYGEKSDSGMSSMSLREIHAEEGAQEKGFPVRVRQESINNERKYGYIEFTKLAPNNSAEYYILDEESVALEGGEIIEGTFSFNDLAPFSTDGEDITDEDRAAAAKTAYEAAVRKLKASRRKYAISVTTTEIPHDLKVGDKIRLMYANRLLELEGCSNYMKKIMSFDDLFYITQIQYSFGAGGSEVNTLRLEKELRVDREEEMS